MTPSEVVSLVQTLIWAGAFVILGVLVAPTIRYAVQKHYALREKQVERERSEGHFYVTECAYGCFERAIPLPEEVQADKAHASYKNGVLRVEFPRTEPVRRRKISVN